jgi:hypothetical protein
MLQKHILKNLLHSKEYSFQFSTIFLSRINLEECFKRFFVFSKSYREYTKTKISLLSCITGEYLIKTALVVSLARRCKLWSIKSIKHEIY